MVGLFGVAGSVLSLVNRSCLVGATVTHETATLPGVGSATAYFLHFPLLSRTLILWGSVKSQWLALCPLCSGHARDLEGSSQELRQGPAKLFVLQQSPTLLSQFDD